MARRKTTRKPHTRTPATNVPASTRVTGGQPRSTSPALPARPSTTAFAGGPLVELAPSAASGLLDAVLELTGAEHQTLRQALGAWQREQDRVLNRSWRRPGGLAHPIHL